MKKAVLILMVAALLMLAGCGTKVSDIRDDTDKYLGKEVTLSGKAMNAVKIGQLSGFTLKQDSGSIPVASSKIPEEGEKVTVKGTVVRGLFGVHIQASKVS